MDQKDSTTYPVLEKNRPDQLNQPSWTSQNG